MYKGEWKGKRLLMCHAIINLPNITNEVNYRTSNDDKTVVIIVTFNLITDKKYNLLRLCCSKRVSNMIMMIKCDCEIPPSGSWEMIYDVWSTFYMRACAVYKWSSRLIHHRAYRPIERQWKYQITHHKHAYMHTYINTYTWSYVLRSVAVISLFIPIELFIINFKIKLL